MVTTNDKIIVSLYGASPTACSQGQYNGFMASDWRPRTKILTK